MLISDFNDPWLQRSAKHLFLPIAGHSDQGLWIWKDLVHIPYQSKPASHQGSDPGTIGRELETEDFNVIPLV